MNQDPNQDQDQFKRVMIFAAAALALLMGWNILNPPPRPVAQPAPAAAAAPGGAAVPAGITAAGASAPAPAPANPVSATPEAPVIAATEESRYTLTRGLTTVVFTNRGATVASWTLDGSVEHAKSPVELVHPFSREPEGLRALALAGGADADALNSALWRCAALAERIDCDYSAGGLAARKSLVLHDNFLHELEFSASRAGAPLPLAIGWGPGFGRQLTVAERKSNFSLAKGNMVPLGERRALDLTVPRKQTTADHPGVYEWFGVNDNFYGALFVPADRTARTVTVAMATHALPPGPSGKIPDPELLPRVTAPFGAGKLFVGPKKYFELKQLGHRLELSTGFETWMPGVGAISVWLYQALRALAASLHSWGLAIIVLTILFRLAMLPLVFNASVNMRVSQVKIAALQPKIDAINKKYAKKGGVESWSAKGEEMQALYKKHGINQMSSMLGCLPLLLQMPLFFGFFNLLSKVIDMKGQRFLHAPDLTAADPWLLLPILSGVFQFISSWIGAKTITDRFMRWQMMLMPVFFSFFFLFYPAGLSLYWAVSNLFTIGQQLLINRIGDKKAADEKARQKLKEALEA